MRKSILSFGTLSLYHKTHTVMNTGVALASAGISVGLASWGLARLTEMNNSMSSSFEAEVYCGLVLFTSTENLKKKIILFYTKYVKSKIYLRKKSASISFYNI